MGGAGGAPQNSAGPEPQRGGVCRCVGACPEALAAWDQISRTFPWAFAQIPAAADQVRSGAPQQVMSSVLSLRGPDGLG